MQGTAQAKVRLVFVENSISSEYQHVALLFQEAELKKILQSDNSSLDFDFRNFEPIPLPLDPDIYIRGIIPEKTKVFKVIEIF